MIIDAPTEGPVTSILRGMPHALITGTSSGFGLLTAERLAALGWTVTGAMRDPARASEERRWESIELDLSDESSIEAVAGHVGAKHGRVDALISDALQQRRNAKREQKLLRRTSICILSLRWKGGRVV